MNAEITVPVKYVSNFWRTLEMPLISEINLILACSANYFISELNRVTTFAITDTKLYVRVVTLSTNANVKLLQDLKSGFKRINTVNWNK